MTCLSRMRRDQRTQQYVALGAPWRARASERSSAASNATRSQGGLPRARLLRRPLLAHRSNRGGSYRRREQRRLTIGASLR
jgi:hypothetical protein